MSKILITGGHLTPALAFIDWLKVNHPAVEVVYVGREYAQVATKQASWEREEVSKRDIEFIPFEGQKTGSFNLLAFVATINEADRIIREKEITGVLSFGGYLAVPFAIAARRLHLPLITHEQTRVLGRANRLVSFLADATALSFPDTLVPFYVRHTTVTGNPLRSGIFDPEAARPEWFAPRVQLPVLYVAGGSQGSKAINDLILPLLPQLTADYIVVHQVGRASATRSPLAEIQNNLRQQRVQLDNYFPREFLTEKELAYLYPRTTIAISRAGANTLAELTAFGIPTIYIPLPQANYREQERNARALEAVGAAFVHLQNELNPARLMGYLIELQQRQNEVSANLRQFAPLGDECEQIYALLEKAISLHQQKLSRKTVKNPQPSSRLQSTPTKITLSQEKQLTETPENQVVDLEAAAKKTFIPPQRPQPNEVTTEEL